MGGPQTGFCRNGQHDWRLNTSASAIRTRFGPAISIPTTDGAELEGANSLPIAFFNNESYTIALLLKGRSGGASTKHLYRSGVSSTDDHILWLASGVTPEPVPRQQHGHGDHHVQCFSRSGGVNRDRTGQRKASTGWS